MKRTTQERTTVQRVWVVNCWLKGAHCFTSSPLYQPGPVRQMLDWAENVAKADEVELLEVTATKTVRPIKFSDLPEGEYANGSSEDA